MKALIGLVVTLLPLSVYAVNILPIYLGSVYTSLQGELLDLIR